MNQHDQDTQLTITTRGRGLAVGAAAIVSSVLLAMTVLSGIGPSAADDSGSASASADTLVVVPTGEMPVALMQPE